MNWFDAGIIVVLLIFVAFGIKKGFMFSVIDMFGVFVNFVIALFLCKPLRAFLNVCGMETGIAGSLAKHYSAFEGFTINLKSYSGNISDFVNESIKNSGMSGFGKKLFNGIINNNLAGETGKLAQSSAENITLSDIISKSIAQFITVVLAFIIAFALIYVALLVLRIISKRMQQSKFVNVFDKIFGGCFGLVKGFMFVVAIFVVLSFFSDNGLLSSVINYINHSAIGHWLRTSVNNFMVEYVNIKQFIIDLLNKL